MTRDSNSAGPRIGVDLGGTKIELLAIDHEGGELLRERVPTPRGSYDDVIDCVRALVVDAEDKLGARASVGVGTPGSLSPTRGHMRNANTVCLNGHALDVDLSTALGREVRIANDANCFALSEAVDGAARDARIVFGVIVGTGTGGGVVIDRQPWIGANAVAGEWGHNPLPWPSDDERPGPACYCGKRGCIETFLSGPGIAHDHRAFGGDSHAGATQLDARAIAEAAAAGDPAAQRTLGRHADRMARALATVINLLDPDVVVLGGGVSLIAGLPEAVAQRLPAHVFTDRVCTPIVRALHGDAGGVRGAAWLWPRQRGPA